MSDKEAKFPRGAALVYPDGSRYVYLQAAEDLSDGMFIEANVNGRLVKFKGELKFSQGICIETTPKEYWTFVMISTPTKAVPPVPAIEM